MVFSLSVCVFIWFSFFDSYQTASVAKLLLPALFLFFGSLDVCFIIYYDAFFVHQPAYFVSAFGSSAFARRNTRGLYHNTSCLTSSPLTIVINVEQLHKAGKQLYKSVQVYIQVCSIYPITNMDRSTGNRVEYVIKDTQAIRQPVSEGKCIHQYTSAEDSKDS